MRSPDPRRSGLFLEWALLFTFVCHGAAMVGMVLFLLPGIPGGGVVDDAARVAYVAAHPWRWRLGWLPWQLTALSDLLVGIALVRTRWIPRGPAIAVLVLTVMAIVPDQTAQAIWVTEGVEVARSSVAASDLAPYLALEQRLLPLTSAWAATLYTLAAIGWSVTFARAGAWSRTLTVVSIVAWTVFLVVSVGILLPPSVRLGPDVLAAGNAIGFLLLQVWTVLVAKEVMKRSRTDATHGRYAPWRHPDAGEA
jgi:hypothetical protein